MWWGGSGCGPMNGWWIMPIFGVLCLFIVLFFVSRFIGAGGGFCGRAPAERDSGMEELRKEIRALRDEVKDLKEKTGKAEQP